MARPRTDKRWVNAIYDLEGDRVLNRKRGKPNEAAINKAMARTLERKAKEDPLYQNCPPPPSPRTIGRIREGFQGLRKEQQREYGYVRWPESFSDGLLPWESVRACLDLVGFFEANGFDRPTRREALWFWRMTLALPEADVHRRASLARTMIHLELAMAEKVPLPFTGSDWLSFWRVSRENPFPPEFSLPPLREPSEVMVAVERLLIFQPWTSQRNLDACRGTKSRAKVSSLDSGSDSENTAGSASQD